MDLKRAMAANVRRLRRAAGHSQAELAWKAGISSRYLSSIERGVVSATVTVLGKIARALKVDPCEIIRSPPPR
jgi:transcriptional regulator with XRE-family HTH domain